MKGGWTTLSYSFLCRSFCSVFTGQPLVDLLLSFSIVLCVTLLPLKLGLSNTNNSHNSSFLSSGVRLKGCDAYQRFAITVVFSESENVKNAAGLQVKVYVRGQDAGPGVNGGDYFSLL